MSDGHGTWLLTELDPGKPSRAFDLGSPGLGYVDLTELVALRGRLRLPVERDRHFIAARTLSAYANDAQLTGRITT